jgi:hypothetical protein
VVTGGVGDDEYASDDNEGSYADDDISDLHFRVQEPFGPGDLGRPLPPPETGSPYMSDMRDRMAPWPGYEPRD